MGQTPPPVLISQPSSTRAIALESLNFVSEPFKLASPQSFGDDRRTRIMLFALNLSVPPGATLAAIRADAEDASHRHYDLQVEYVGPVPDQEWLTAVVLRLSDNLSDVGDVLVRVTRDGIASNRVRVAIGHMGGGPADDQGAMPTPAPPYVIAGQITSGGQSFSGVTVTLTGSQTETVLTDASGGYRLTVPIAGGSYSVTPSHPFFDFSGSRTFINLSGNHTNVNFTALRRSFTISGKVLNDLGSGINGVQVSIRNEANQILAGMFTAGGGNYSFSNLPAGFRYTVGANATSFFTFAPRSITALADNQTLNLTGVLRKYSFRGRITEGANGVSGVNVALTGAEQAVTTTDFNGNFTFANVIAGGTYTLTPTKSQYVFSPPSLYFVGLAGDKPADFGASFRYYVAGRVANITGQGLAGITMTVSGSQSASTLTALDGTYSFALAPTGNYTITPSIEQSWYLFGPASQNLSNLTGNQTLNFTSSQAPLPNPASVLEFDGSPKTVDYGYIWEPHVDLGHFFWEFWAMPGNNAGARYLLSDGYGGAHALLFGFGSLGGSEPGRYQFIGNIYNGITYENYFRSDQGPAPGEWGHFAVGWDGKNVMTYLNGVPVGKIAFNGPRRTPGIGGGGGRLLIGGSDHGNLDGRIAQLRGYEGRNPLEDPTGADQSRVESAFDPQNVFDADGDLGSHFFVPAPRVADVSRGLNGVTHPGLLRGTINGILSGCAGCPLPTFVLDPTAPNFATGTPAAPVVVGNAPPVPVGARIFDSFSRPNSTYIFDGKGGLGATEGGTAGAKLWQTSVTSQQKPFGILNGRAVMLGNSTYITWIPTGSASANLDIRVDRRPGVAGSGHDTGLSFRVVGGGNFFFAYTSPGSTTAGPRSLTVGYYLNNQRVNLVTGVSMPATWSTLRVVTRSSGEISVFAGTTQVYATTSNIFPTATGAGLFNNSAGLGLVNRWDNFTVFDGP